MILRRNQSVLLLKSNQISLLNILKKRVFWKTNLVFIRLSLFDIKNGVIFLGAVVLFPVVQTQIENLLGEILVVYLLIKLLKCALEVVPEKLGVFLLLL